MDSKLDLNKLSRLLKSVIIEEAKCQSEVCLQKLIFTWLVWLATFNDYLMIMLIRSIIV